MASPPKKVQASEDISDRLEDLKKRFHLLEGDRKAYFETTQWTIQHNKERILALRAENKDILSSMTELQRAVQAQMEGNNEADRMAWQIREIRKRHDDVKHKLEDRTRYLDKLRDDMKSLLMETPSELEDDSLPSVVRNLENRIEKTAIRQNEILERLTNDRIGYDTRADTLEATLQSKKKELDDLTTLYQDALRSKELARDELAKCEKLSQDEKRRLDSMLEDKKQRIKQLMEANDRMERRARREEARRSEYLTKARPPTPPSKALNHDAMNRRATQLEVSFKKLVAAAGVSDGPGLIQHVLSQNEMQRTLEAHQRDGEARLDALRAESMRHRTQLRELRLAADDSPSTTRLVDEYEAKLAQAQTTYLRARSKYERTAKARITLLAGVEHLVSKLQFIEPNEAFPALTDASLPEILALCERKLSIAQAVTADQISVEDTALSPLPPAYTVRIRFPFNDKQVVVDEDPSLDDEIPTYEQIKFLSASIVDRELKRKRKPVKKTPPTTSRSRGVTGSSTSRLPTSSR